MIEAGHAHRDIGRYTWAQFTAYLRQANRRKRDARRFELLASAIGNAGGEAVKKALKALDEEP